jgi:hypothetical protein
VFVSIYMEAAMHASARQVAREKILYVKVVPAAGTDGECRLEYRPAEKDDPDHKNHSQGRIRMIPLVRHKHRRYIGKAHQPQTDAAGAYFVKFGGDM